MKIAVLSDTRFPTSVSYAGHGLGRSIAKIAAGLAARGHAVTLYGAAGSCVEGCEVVVDTDENVRADTLREAGKQYDVYLDSTHHFGLSKLTDYPVVSKVCDMEDTPARNAVYNSRQWAAQRGVDNPVIVYEGLDVANYPYNSAEREPYMVWVGANYNVVWKRLDIALGIAQFLNVKLKLVGVSGLQLPAGDYEQIQTTSHAETTVLMACARAVIGWLPTFTHVEAAAMGTPALGSYDNAHNIEDGVTGYQRHTPEELAIVAQRNLGDIKSRLAREWVADNRSIAKQVSDYERLLERTANGEVW